MKKAVGLSGTPLPSFNSASASSMVESAMIYKALPSTVGSSCSMLGLWRTDAVGRRAKYGSKVVSCQGVASNGGASSHGPPAYPLWVNLRC